MTATADSMSASFYMIQNVTSCNEVTKQAIVTEMGRGICRLLAVYPLTSTLEIRVDAGAGGKLQYNALPACPDLESGQPQGQ